MKNGGYRIMKSILAWVNGLSLTSKIVAAVVAGAVVVGGVTTAVIVANNGGNGTADTGAPTSSVSESLTAETNSTITSSTAETETSTEESSSTEASSQTETTSSQKPTAPSSQAPTTPSSSAPATPQPAAFAVYINGKAVDLGALERVKQKVSFRKEYEGAVYKEAAGDVYADAEKLTAALGMRHPTDQENSQMNGGASTFNIVYVAKDVSEANGGCYIEYFAIVDNFDVMALSTIRYDASWNGSDWSQKNLVFCSIMPKMSGGKLQVPVSFLCELLGYQYELKDTGLYIAK
jgi:hypothetical protein